ncbi:MAG TPA: LuxR C-terminal-related transcriptional regulator, partial [Actinomycetota bacterium]|nr:LuxR C-terminal-related transcriptional regulator [Actinomycetota bacterium]
LQLLESIHALILWRLGRPREADLVTSTLEASRWARMHLGPIRVWAAAESGDTARAVAMLDAWWAECGDESNRQWARAHPEQIHGGKPEIFAILAEMVLAAYGHVQIDDDILAMARAYELNCRQGSDDTPVFVTLLYGRILIREQRLEEAEERVGAARELLAAQPMALHAATAEELRGLLAAARGANDDALSCLDAAARQFELTGNLLDQARALRCAAASGVAAGADRDGVAERLRRARSLAVDAGAASEMHRIESEMRALGLRPRAGRPKGPRRAPGTLSAREQEVVSLLAAGGTNAEIAGRLFLSERTVQDHIASAQKRLGVSGRAGLAAWAAKNGLV